MTIIVFEHVVYHPDPSIFSRYWYDHYKSHMIFIHQLNEISDRKDSAGQKKKEHCECSFDDPATVVLTDQTNLKRSGSGCFPTIPTAILL